MRAHRLSAALTRARSRSRIHPSLRGLDRDITPAVSSPEGVLPLLFLVMRCVGVRLADTRRVGVSVGGSPEPGIAEAIAAASRRHRHSSPRLVPPRQNKLHRRLLRRRGSKTCSCLLSLVCSHLRSHVFIVTTDATRELWLRQIRRMRTTFETLSTKNAGIALRDAVSSITRAARLSCGCCRPPMPSRSAHWAYFCPGRKLIRLCRIRQGTA
jgi:hypothetical protein